MHTHLNGANEIITYGVDLCKGKLTIVANQKTMVYERTRYGNTVGHIGFVFVVHFENWKPWTCSGSWQAAEIQMSQKPACVEFVSNNVGVMTHSR